MDFATNVLEFFSELELNEKLPKDVEVLNPYRYGEALPLASQFYKKYYSDNHPRTFLIGINPGRQGSGLTGIGFTDPINLRDRCGIDNDFERKHELSSKFIYRMISELGGEQSFYKDFYFTSVSPLGFVKDGRNLNYYDIPALQSSLEPFIVRTMKLQLEFGANPTAFSIGQGKNVAFLKYLNKKYQLFDKVIPLPHPRWIMQYRLKRIEEFLKVYKDQLTPQMS